MLLPLLGRFSSMRIRPATVLDAPAITDVHQASVEARIPGQLETGVGHADDGGRDSWEKVLADPGSRTIWVAVCEGQIVGVLCVNALGAGEIQPLRIDELFFHPDQDNTEVKSALLGYAIGDAPAFLELVTPPQSDLDFWASEGFMQTDTGRGDLADADTAILVRS